MMYKWKVILTNWINCYLTDDKSKGGNGQNVDMESLLYIISHLRENMNLDESKSSTLEAQTVNEFITEKYSEFKFQNGSAEAASDEDMYVVASLLLFFMCVNSKNIDLKSAMCCKLSAEDQETILKFSQSLMKCTSITYVDLQNAIAEACGQDVGISEPVGSYASQSVAETPPALRSLHGEVRRLQAALDAERFDRNYLQEELSRTNLKVEKLLKEKEQYKLNIVNLKAKISLCCGKENEVHSSDAKTDPSAELMRQLQETEERLFQTQEKVDEMLSERDAYKNKVTKLKQERDKWMAISLQESTHVSQLKEKLEAAHHQVQCLQDMVVELRQHNRLNGLDTSQLECDDPDGSIQSLLHNSSVCSEVGANVVEVLLAEERSKGIAQRQQIQILQERLIKELEKLTVLSDEKKNLEQQLSAEISSKKIIDRDNELLIADKKLLEAKIIQLSKEKNDNDKKIDHLMKEKSRLMTECDEKTAAIELLLSEKKILMQEFDNLTKVKDATSNEKDMLSAENKALNKITADLKSAQDALLRDKQVLEVEKEILMKVLDEEKSACNKCKTEKNQLLIELNELNQKHTDELNIKESEVEKLIRNLKELTTEFETKKHDYNNKIDDLIKEKSKMMTECEEKTAAIEKLISEKKSLIEEYDNLNKVKDIISKEKDVLRLENKELNETTTDLKSLQDALISSKQVLEAQNENILKSLNEEKSARDESETEKKHLLIKLNDLNQKYNEELNVKENAVEKLTSNIKELKIEYEKERDANNNKIEDLIKEKSKLMTECNEKTATIELLISEKRSLIQEFNNLNKVKDAISDEKDMLSAENKALNKIMADLKSAQDSLLSDKQVLEAEKKTLLKSLREDKLARHECDTERSQLLIELNDFKQKHIEELNIKKSAVEILTSDLKDIKTEFGQEKDDLIQEKHKLMMECNEKTAAIELLISEKRSVMQESENLNKIKDSISKEKDMLSAENKVLNEITADLKSTQDALLSEKQVLEAEKETLLTSLSEEKSAHDECETEKNQLLMQLNELNKKHIEELNIKENAIEKLTSNLKDLKTEFEKERHDNNNKINDLFKEKSKLMIECNEKTAAIELLISEKTSLMQEFDNFIKIKDSIFKEKDMVCTENKVLNEITADLKSVQDVLLSDKQVLEAEKETLLMSFSEEKSARDECETEKNQLMIKLNDINQKHTEELIIKESAVEKLTIDFKELKTLFKSYQELFHEISSQLSKKLVNVLNNLKKQDVENEMLNKIISMENIQNASVKDQCEFLLTLTDALTIELSLRKNSNIALEHENAAFVRELVSQNDTEVHDLHNRVKELEDIVCECKKEISKQKDDYDTTLDVKIKDIQKLQCENQSLNNDLNDVKLQLEIKVYSLKEKLTDNENLTEKLKGSYECQIENLNLMINKLTNYLKDKTCELDGLRQEKDRLQQVVNENHKVIKSLEDEIKIQKQNQEKLITDFESERLVLNNMVIVTESVMEDQKISLNKIINEHLNTNELLKQENDTLKVSLDTAKEDIKDKLKEKDAAFEMVFTDLTEVRKEKDELQTSSNSILNNLNKEVNTLTEELRLKSNILELREAENKNLVHSVEKLKADIALLQDMNVNLALDKNNLEAELENKIKELSCKLEEQVKINSTLELQHQEKVNEVIEVKDAMNKLNTQINILVKEKCNLEQEQSQCMMSLTSEIDGLRKENQRLQQVIDENHKVITNLEQHINHELEENKNIREDVSRDKMGLLSKCSLLEEYQIKAEKFLEDRQKEIHTLKEEVKTLQNKLDICEQDLRDKDGFISKISKEKDVVINTISKELSEEKSAKEMYEKEIQLKSEDILKLKAQVEASNNEIENINLLRKENELMAKFVGQGETFAAVSQEKGTGHKYSGNTEKELRDPHQVDNISDIIHSSMESIKTITDLEKIVHDKNRTITTLQSDITYLKTLIGESENKLLDATKELEISKENCQQLSSQLKKIVYQKNEEIAELKKQVNKMSVTENRATQIIKVSAKYQAIILKRIAEIKSNTVLKELTNFGNSNIGDNELRRSLNAGTITMEDLENFLETTDRHLKRCSEKQILLQKEKDRLIEVNRINESEIINLKKFLTEISVSFQTFSSVKDLYAQKLSRVVSIQRTVRREILNLDGRITDVAMCKLERGYAAVMQDLSECAMNLQRWVERSIGRTISPEKIKQAFTSEVDRESLATTSYQNTGIEVQLEELENSFQKLLEEIMQAQNGDGAKDTQAVTVMEVRAEYEDKLNRMKAKMKQLYQEQIGVYMEKQKEANAVLERELQKAREKLAESSKAYEEHIKALTTELWSVGEKFLMKKDEAEWLRRKQNSGSLMSLQHMHSSGLVPSHEAPSRPSDTHSLRSLPGNNKREGRGLHMSDEEGEVFDNRYLKELSRTPRDSHAPQRLSELRWRNSLCPPHLRSSYPAETQFAHTFDEEDIKCATAMGVVGNRQQRKEVGITAYKKPGPPTPSKQAGRLSATDSELRESLRVESEPFPSRKTSTPSRIRALFRSSKNDTIEVTPRKRLSNIFRKK